MTCFWVPFAISRNVVSSCSPLLLGRLDFNSREVAIVALMLVSADARGVDNLPESFHKRGLQCLNVL